ncbi:MAG: MarR family transcriptional regulator [Candidatus Marinimicrobia bacterium]|jgi:DNA-binding MarR family transcriptional regulator|nr:MarR family transcriptional regulator [Candidatus Neomarinimicrobiota bacterium]MBT3937017.1 MarR family transcriptional regulator [Candidatus Neomarinimicrobiota bacterium]MBT3960603.1 MarR family transcriptional regulator [Candidatus Neomarinimicrobiota bacterium]MBT4383114.1 MarR family transcriptional regulator [Candidatus Neomarinimicrobiota bacterium]MBT4636290.1 MarR family transcriptional regulator [Candidatus Neomarinimicrobiota bacterium]
MEFGELLKSFLLNLQGLYRTEVTSNSLSLPQALAMSIIPDRGINMSTFSSTLGIDNSTATRMVDRLIKKKWVEKEKDPYDRRVILVRLTEIGTSIQEEIESNIDVLGDKIESTVSMDDRDEVREILSSFQWTLSKYILDKNKIV